MKRKLLPPALTVLLLLSACGGSPQPSATTEAPSATPTASVAPPPSPTEAPLEATYVTIGDCFFGAALSDGTWKDEGFTVAELLAVPTYTAYTADGQPSDATTVYLYTGEGPGGFEAEAGKRLNTYASGDPDEITGLLPFSLPVSIVGNDARIALPNYNARLVFDLNAVAPLVLSKPVTVLPRPVEQIEPTDDMTAAVKSKLDGYGLYGAPAEIKAAYRLDPTGDTPLTLIIAGSPAIDGYPVVSADEYTYRDSGSYAMCLLYDGTTATTLAEHHKAYDFDTVPPTKTPPSVYMVSDHCYALQLLGCYDVNGDGTMEIALRDAGWEWGSGVLFTLANGKWQRVLESHYGS